MECEPCQRDLNQYDPACVNCGTRYIRAIQKVQLEITEKRKWLRKVLSDWMAFGHDEATLRGQPVKVAKNEAGGKGGRKPSKHR